MTASVFPPAQAMFLRPLGALCIALLVAISLALYCYSQWQAVQDNNARLVQQLEQQRRGQQQQLSRIGRRLGQLQAELGQVASLSQRLQQDYALGDELATGKIFDSGLLQRSFSGFAELNMALNLLASQAREQGRALSTLESLLLNLHINEITQVHGHPVPTGQGRLSSTFGNRRDPFTGQGRWHSGIDFSGELGTPIAATGAGIVSLVTEHPAYGRMIELNHGQGWTTRYAHLDKQLVSVGDKVENGQLIALMGRTGRTTGVHLHYEVLKGNKRLDPARFLPQ
ncbi:M23 family metallopeptidase [Zobellella maritima]|uniref:M23 family metallopeptidase n=1 Tax=Zobellella maritima TaxID=2059725 RepID=UPI000E306BCE|nr:M23 family metallopeptidase [Zobellella maritima]